MTTWNNSFFNVKGQISQVSFGWYVNLNKRKDFSGFHRFVLQSYLLHATRHHVCVLSVRRGQKMVSYCLIFFPAVGEVSYRTRLLCEWRTIPCYPSPQPPSLPTSSWVFHQHPLFSPAAVVTGVWGFRGSRVGEKHGKSFAVYLWKLRRAPVLRRLWMWQSQLCGECEPLLCQGWTGEAHNSI